eukprot:786023-Rhodomonas_salina.5
MTALLLSVLLSQPASQARTAASAPVCKSVDQITLKASFRISGRRSHHQTAMNSGWTMTRTASGSGYSTGTADAGPHGPGPGHVPVVSNLNGEGQEKKAASFQRMCRRVREFRAQRKRLWEPREHP